MDAKTPTVAVYIDNSNLIHAVQDSSDINGRLDYTRFISHLTKGYQVAAVNIYLGETETNASFLSYLFRNGFAVRSKQIKKITRTVDSSEVQKCNFDVEITLDVFETIANTEIAPDKVILVSGDSDFVALVRKLQDANVKVEVVSGYRSLSKELKNAADSYLFLENLWEQVRMQ